MSELPNGKTIIDHKIRVELELEFDEYVFMDFLYTINKDKSQKLTYDIAFKKTGIVREDINSIVKACMLRGLIEKDKHGKWIVLDKWNKHFDVDKDFNEFWEIFKKRGSKVEAQKHFTKTIKLVEKDKLFNAAKKYIASVSDPIYIMHASKFLNPNFKRWEDVVETKEVTDTPKFQYEGTFIK